MRDGRCKPQCQPACRHGTCTAPDTCTCRYSTSVQVDSACTCTCSPGYSGVVCETAGCPGGRWGLSCSQAIHLSHPYWPLGGSQLTFPAIQPFSTVITFISLAVYSFTLFIVNPYWHMNHCRSRHSDKEKETIKQVISNLTALKRIAYRYF